MTSHRSLRTAFLVGVMLTAASTAQASHVATSWHSTTNAAGEICATFCIKYVSPEGDEAIKNLPYPTVTDQMGLPDAATHLVATTGESTSVDLTPSDSKGGWPAAWPSCSSGPNGLVVEFCWTYCFPEPGPAPGDQLIIKYTAADPSGGQVSGVAIKGY